MKNYLKTIGAFMLGICLLSSCHSVEPNPGEEAVLIDKPWIWGHKGVRDKVVQPGLKWLWFSTHFEIFQNIPVRYDVVFDDIMSNDNTPLDYATYLTLRISPGRSPQLLKNYGTDWFKNNVEATYRNYVREEISKYSPFDLMSNREVCNNIDSTVTEKVKVYFKELSASAEFPVEVMQVITGRAKPNEKQLAEMNNTAAAIQAKQTQERNAEMEEAREKAERQRAKADKAYMQELNLSPSQFIQLKGWEVIEEKSGANIDVLVSGSGAEPMWNIRR